MSKNGPFQVRLLYVFIRIDVVKGTISRQIARAQVINQKWSVGRPDVTLGLLLRKQVNSFSVESTTN